MADSNDDTGRDFGPDILIVDDDHSTLAELGQGLREVGYVVRVASSGGEALRHCDEQVPELAMLTTRLPDMPGRDVAVDLRQRNIPFIFVSGDGDHGVVEQSIELGACSYLYKPLDTGKLVPVIKAALQRGAELRQTKLGSHPPNAGMHILRETSVAIGVLMERHRLSVDEAFEALRRHARSQRRKMSEVAAQVVRAAEDINIPVRGGMSGARRTSDKSGK